MDKSLLAQSEAAAILGELEDPDVDLRAVLGRFETLLLTMAPTFNPEELRELNGILEGGIPELRSIGAGDAPADIRPVAPPIPVQSK